MTIDKERLRVLAEAATPGPWILLPVEDGSPYLRVRGARLGARYKVANVLAPTYFMPRDGIESTANAEFIVAARDAVPALLSENAAKEKQLAAYATLVKSIEERQRLASDEHAKAIEARDSLQSERDANSILTTENAALAAEVERLRGYIVRMRDSLKFGAITGFEADQCRMGAAFLEAAMADKGAPT